MPALNVAKACAIIWPGHVGYSLQPQSTYPENGHHGCVDWCETTESVQVHGKRFQLSWHLGTLA